jgi:hypothetical protein
MAAMETEEWIEHDDGVTGYRASARNLLAHMTQEVKQALKEAGIEIDVFVVIPATGDAVATFGTLADPSDEVWSRVSEIVCSIVRRSVGLTRTRCREVVCASTAEIPALQEGAEVR